MPVISSNATNLNTEHLSSVADDDVEFLEELWECFVEEYESSFESLKGASEGKNKDEAVLYSHNIKSGSANLGAEKLKEISAGMESASKTEDYQTVLDSLDNLQAAYDELATTFTAWLASLQ